MFAYEIMRRRPAAFRSMTGFSVEAFETLFGAFARAHHDRYQSLRTTKRGNQPRQRAVGAGRRYSHDARTRLVMALVWLRIYPTAQLNQFQVTAQVHRHDRAGHSRIARVVSVLVNQRIRQRPLKSYPTA